MTLVRMIVSPITRVLPCHEVISGCLRRFTAVYQSVYPSPFQTPETHPRDQIADSGQVDSVVNSRQLPCLHLLFPYVKQVVSFGQSWLGVVHILQGCRSISYWLKQLGTNEVIRNERSNYGVPRMHRLRKVCEGTPGTLLTLSPSHRSGRKCECRDQQQRLAR